MFCLVFATCKTKMTVVFEMEDFSWVTSDFQRGNFLRAFQSHCWKWRNGDWPATDIPRLRACGSLSPLLKGTLSGEPARTILFKMESRPVLPSCSLCSNILSHISS